MYSDVEPGKSKIEALRDIVTNIECSAIYAFNDTCVKIDKDNIPNPSGGTYMANAFKYVKAEGFHDALLLTDGEANDKDAALSEVGDDFKVQIMYIGAGPKPDFLNQLAAKAGSFCTIEDLKKPKELTEKVQLLLGAGKNEGPICL
jgi:hypothetical protein